MTGPGAASRGRFDRPIFIVSTPRSGSTLLFETLAQSPGLFTTRRESHGLIESVPGLFPGDRNWDSNRLTAADATPERVEMLAAKFLADLVDRDGKRPPERVRMLEKTPKNALRVPFFEAAWPESIFVYLYRDVRETLASMIEAWLSGRFRTYPRLPGWQGPPWSLLLVPGWQGLIGRPLPEVVARQWSITTNHLLDDLEALPISRVRCVAHAELVAEPQQAIARLAGLLGLEWDRSLAGELPLSKTTLTAPAKDKWRRHEAAIAEVLPLVEQADARARAFLGRLSG